MYRTSGEEQRARKKLAGFSDQSLFSRSGCFGSRAEPCSHRHIRANSATLLPTRCPHGSAAVSTEQHAFLKPPLQAKRSSRPMSDWPGRPLFHHVTKIRVQGVQGREGPTAVLSAGTIPLVPGSWHPVLSSLSFQIEASLSLLDSIFGDGDGDGDGDVHQCRLTRAG